MTNPRILCRATTSELGQRWHVQVQPYTPLITRTIKAVTPATVVLADGDGFLTRYRLDEVDLIEPAN